MSLSKYWQKRDFDMTPEPRGEVAKPGKALHYFIQRHHARRLHYDFRIELNGTLKSWAVPKGPSLDPSDKRLAVHVEDHPLAYGSFEGQIPAGQYGAGEVVLWDKGVWLPIGDAEKGYQSGNLKFVLQGEKLAGKWALVRMGKANQDEEGDDKDGDDKGSQENWLLIKEHDELARKHDEYQITEARPESVLTCKPKKAAKNKQSDASLKSASTHVSSALTVNAPHKKAPLPAQLKPQLAMLVKTAPSGDEWLVELKYDGYRALTKIEHNAARIYTRNGNDWTKQWPVLAKTLSELPIDEAWLDGEVVAFKDGKISFAALQNYEQDDDQIQLRYYLFDIMHLNGQDLSALPLMHRKHVLKTLLISIDHPAIAYSEHIVGNVAEVFKQTCQLKLEGIVIKRADSTYTQARSQSWLKLKCTQRQEFVIGGFTDPEGERNGFGALLLGWYNPAGELMYAGRVGTGFNQQTITTLHKRLLLLEARIPAFVEPPKGLEAKGVHWLKPMLVAEVQFAEWTPDGSVRHASFVSMRNDKKPTEVTREIAVKAQEIEAASAPAKPTASAAPVKKTSAKKLTSKSPSSAKSSAKQSTSKKSTSKKSTKQARAMKKSVATNKESNKVAEIKITHPERIIFSQENITKFELAEYYEAAERWVMPHIINRPLSLLRCPEGAEKECFFQKHLGELTLKRVEKITIPGNDHGEYLVVNDVQGLIELVQMGVIEFHTWGSTTQALNKPDRMIFDLDPDPAVSWDKVMEGARLVQFLLTNIGLTSYLKTTGGKGLHIVVPIVPELEFPVIKEFSKSIANHLATTIPSHFVAVMSKAKRKDKIFVDYLRNGEEATAIAAFSVRAREGAPISVPIKWEALNADLPSNFFNVRNIDARMQKFDDPWEHYFTHPQVISDKMLQTFN